jgi:glyoxylase-like metal-dependent hydrolase (beta-lactamase superfamily II)
MNSWITSNRHSIFQVLNGRSNAFVVFNGSSHWLLVDTGRKGSREKLKKALDNLGIKGTALRAILLTHAHFDHVENGSEIKNLHDALTYAHHSEAPYLASGDNAEIDGTLVFTRLLVRALRNRLAKRFRYTPFTIDHFVHDRCDLSSLGFVDAYIIHTPGHTAGSVSLIVGNEIAIVGDALFGVFKGSVLPPYGSDLFLMVKSWGLLLDTGASLFLPGHGTAINRDLLEKKYAKYCVRLGL